MRRIGRAVLVALALAILLQPARPDGHEEASMPVALAEEAVPGPLAVYARLWQVDPEDPEGQAWLQAVAAGDDGAAYHACLVLARSPAGSAEHYRRALALRYDPGVQLELALSLENAGATAEALEAWLRILGPGEPLEALRRLEPDAVERARQLNRRGLAAEALAEVAGVSGEQAALQRATALARLGRHAEALDHFRTWLRVHTDDHATRVAYAASLEAAGRQGDAEREYRSAGATGRQGLGRLLERAGRLSEAAAAYLGAPEPTARWRGALLLERLGRHGEALAVYAELAAGSSRVAGDAAFRGFTVARRLGLPDGAFRELVPPSSHWAWRLGAWTSPPLEPALPPEQPRALELASLLLSEAVASPLGPWELARIEIEVALPRLSDSQLLAVGQWFVEHGQYHQACRIGMGLLGRLPTKDVYRLAYPLAYREPVTGAAAELALDPFLIWAVMREESHYRPDALSRAGARGLMQVMPATGSWLASKMGLAYRGPGDLYFPDLSVAMGAWYLRYLLDRHGGSEDLALAAYNAGEGNVRRWLSDPIFRESHDFPATIAFTETREYLTRVLDSRLIYRWLYPEFSLPAR